MVKIGLLGAGHLGKIHLKLLKEIPLFDVIGFYDANAENAAKVEAEFGVKAFNSIAELIDACEAIDVVTPTSTHFDCAKEAIKKHKHVFIEKPITSTLKEAKTLMQLYNEANVKVQVGHVERYNPAFIAAKEYIGQPMFIETHRLAQFNPRGTDVSVVLDLMIHDIDIVLSVVRSNIKKISASGVAIVSETPDIANARIEFDNGCVANLTCSRISLKNMRKTRMFQRDAYISVDFLNKEVSIVKISQITGEPDPFAMTIDLGEGKGHKQISFEKPNLPISNAIKQELEDFAKSIIEDTVPTVSISDGYAALDVAYKIIDRLKISSNILEN